ncbi:MAG: PAS domain-containing sensor histidine kinase [Deltaproteobacteria bacterium]|nr:PAS domain-containing sensor histidine kinase [Deltaproteobacteria bacterium]
MRSRLLELQHFRSLLSADPRIRNRFLAIVSLLVLLLFLIGFSIQQGIPDTGTSESRLMLFVAINVNIVLIAIVFYLIARNLLKLAYEHRHRTIGVRLKTKLITAFVILSLPAMGFHLFASTFIARTLESWLEGQHETVVNNAQRVVETFHLDLKRLMELQGAALAGRLQEWHSPSDSGLSLPPSPELGAGIAVYSSEREVLSQRLHTPLAQELWTPLAETEWLQVQGQDVAWIVEERGGRMLYRHFRKAELGGQVRFVEIFRPTPRALTHAVNALEEQILRSRVFVESQDLIRRYYIVVFLLMTFFILFVSIWLAFYLARGFVEPIEQLAVATQRVSEGEVGYQVELEEPLDRDFALLVNSFNAMSRDLQEYRQGLVRTTENLQESNRVLEEHTRFLDLVLENISTGVMSLDMDGHIEGLNRAAKQMLQLKTSEFQGKHFREVLDRESLAGFEEMFQSLQTIPGKSVMRNLTVSKQGAPIQVSSGLFALENREGQPVGMVSVYHNITEMQRLQRAQAWREVARRIAHEVKNPLTPIQLSAERIRRKYSGLVENDATLEQATQTIIQEVQQLKQMVSEFSNFAKIPESNPQANDLNSIILEAVQLYDGNLPARIRLDTHLAADLPLLPLDREQMRRVFINLIDNAIDAIENKGRLSRIFKQGGIVLTTRFDSELRIVRVEVEDNGTGIESEIADRLFEPYATTKDDGTGLGLTILHQTLADHNGFVRFQNLESGGACFTLELPVS